MTPTFRNTQLFGGNIEADLPSNFIDVSDLRQVPDHQEVYLDKDSLVSLDISILERVSECNDDVDAFRYHLEDLTEGDKPIYLSNIEPDTMPKLGTKAVVLSAVATTTPASTSDGKSTAISMVLVRLQSYATDIVVTINAPYQAEEQPRSSHDEPSPDSELIQQSLAIRAAILRSLHIKSFDLFA